MVIELLIVDTAFDTEECSIVHNYNQNPYSVSVHEVTMATEDRIHRGDKVQPGEPAMYTVTTSSELGLYYFQDDNNPDISGQFRAE